MKDYYYILGLTKVASTEDIKWAYRKLSLKFHPDHNNGDKYFEARFREIQEAYEVLCNDAKRKEYDLKLNAKASSLDNTKASQPTSSEMTSKTSDNPKHGNKSWLTREFKFGAVIVLLILLVFFVIQLRIMNINQNSNVQKDNLMKVQDKNEGSIYSNKKLNNYSDWKLNDTTIITAISSEDSAFSKDATDYKLKSSLKIVDRIYYIGIRDYDNSALAYRKLKQFSDYGHDLIILQVDVDKYVLAVPINTMISDTTKVKDSLRLLFGGSPYIFYNK